MQSSIDCTEPWNEPSTIVRSHNKNTINWLHRAMFWTHSYCAFLVNTQHITVHILFNVETYWRVWHIAGCWCVEFTRNLWPLGHQPGKRSKTMIVRIKGHFDSRTTRNHKWSDYTVTNLTNCATPFFTGDPPTKGLYIAVSQRLLIPKPPPGPWHWTRVICPRQRACQIVVEKKNAYTFQHRRRRLPLCVIHYY